MCCSTATTSLQSQLRRATTLKGWTAVAEQLDDLRQEWRDDVKKGKNQEEPSTTKSKNHPFQASSSSVCPQLTDIIFPKAKEEEEEKGEEEASSVTRAEAARKGTTAQAVA